MGYTVETLLLLSALVSPTIWALHARPYEPPVIGILSQEYYHSIGIAPNFKGHKSYIAASYVKAVEGAGAMVVPIQIGQPREYYEKVMSHINGLVFPGGAAYFNATDGYKDAGNILLQIAKKMNLRGDYFPILGVCLGFELLLFLDNEQKELRTKCNYINEDLSLKFLKGGHSTGIYKTFPKKYLRALSKDNITHNYHIWCITKASMNETNLSDSWNILTESKSAGQVKFVSSVQSKRFPFVGLQFHPEKSAFEWNTKSHFNHSRISIETSRLFYDWLAVEASLSKHSYPSPSDLYKEVIYNYAPVMTYPHNRETSFEQIYFFD